LADVTALRFGSLLKRVFGIKAIDPGRFLVPTIQPVASPFDVTYAPEQRADRGERNFQGNALITNTSAVNFGGTEIPNPIASGRMIVVRRVRLDVLLPTSTNQPGNVHFDMLLGVVTQTPVNGANAKDCRFFTPGSPVGKGLATLVNFTSGATTIVQLQTSTYAVLFPGAAATPTSLTFDNVDIVITPGFGLDMILRSDVLPAATYNYYLTVEGYERALEPGEALPPPQ
jgi:hypothetical protein